MCGFTAVLLQDDLKFSQNHPGEEPFLFCENRYLLVFNGEIYNAKDLRDDLQGKGYEFLTTSSHEVIGYLFVEKGLNAFKELRGMFSILIWDRDEQKVYGARDRFGIKRLYYAEGKHETVFSTEKRNTILPSYEVLIGQEAMQHYFTYQYVPDPLTLHEGILKVRPGHCFVKEINQPITFHQYFHATFKPRQTDRELLMHQIRESLKDSVHAHMQSEEPLGSLLSGGIDSGLIVALAKDINPNLKTFSVGFQRQGYSELEFAKQTADYLGVENISYTITPEEYTESLPEIMWHMEDPLADPACVPLYFAMREASKHVNTVLSGEGADELFGGYNIYREPESLQLFNKLPPVINNLLGKLSTVFPEGVRGKSFLERGTTCLQDRYIGNAKIFDESEKRELLISYDEAFPYHTITGNLYDQVSDEPAVQQMQYIDLHTWLPGDILLKAEKVAKAHSLEVRTPFLDKEVFQVVRGIPVHDKVAEGKTKLILREAFKGVVPYELLYRKKLGFPVPLKHWLKDELYTWARDLISRSQVDHLINKEMVYKLLDQHRKGKGDYARKLWTVLMFMVWHQMHME